MKDLLAKFGSKLDSRAISAAWISLATYYLLYKAGMFLLFASGAEPIIVFGSVYVATIAMLLGLVPPLARLVRHTNANVREAITLDRWLSVMTMFVAAIAGCLLWLVITFSIATMPSNGAFGIEIATQTMVPIASYVFSIGIICLIYPVAFKLVGSAMMRKSSWILLGVVGLVIGAALTTSIISKVIVGSEDQAIDGIAIPERNDVQADQLGVIKAQLIPKTHGIALGPKVSMIMDSCYRGPDGMKCAGLAYEKNVEAL